MMIIIIKACAPQAGRGLPDYKDERALPRPAPLAAQWLPSTIHVRVILSFQQPTFQKLTKH